MKRASNSQDYSSNAELLKASSIQLEIIKKDALLQYKERTHELLNRTNQLNFTKKRLSLKEAVSLLNSSTEKAIINVRDNFEDYGLVGFYEVEDNKLQNFTFSCRILNLGIPQHLCSKLTFSGLEMGLAIAETLDKSIPD